MQQLIKKLSSVAKPEPVIEIPDDETQLIEPNKKLGSPIKAAIQKQIEKEINEASPGWAKYNASSEKGRPPYGQYQPHQPDWFNFETQIKEMIIALLEPKVKQLAENNHLSKTIHNNYGNLKRRLDEMEFVFTKVTKNATIQQDLLTQLETNAQKLKLQEDTMMFEIDKVKEIQDRIQHQFEFIRDDRNGILKKFDNLSGEVTDYRQEISDFKIKITQAFNDRMNQNEKECYQNSQKLDYLKNQIKSLELKLQECVSQDMNKLYFKVDEFKSQLTGQQSQISKLQKYSVVQKTYQQELGITNNQIGWCKSRILKLEQELKDTDEYLANINPLKQKSEIVTALVDVFGDRKKSKQRIKSYMMKAFSFHNSDSSIKKQVTFDKKFFVMPEMPDVAMPGDVIVETKVISNDELLRMDTNEKKNLEWDKEKGCYVRKTEQIVEESDNSEEKMRIKMKEAIRGEGDGTSKSNPVNSGQHQGNVGQMPGRSQSNFVTTPSRYLQNMYKKNAFPLRRFGLYREIEVEGDGFQEATIQFMRKKMNTMTKLRVLWLHTWQGKRAARIYIKNDKEIILESEALFSKTKKLAEAKRTSSRKIKRAKSEDKIFNQNKSSKSLHKLNKQLESFLENHSNASYQTETLSNILTNSGIRRSDYDSEQKKRTTPSDFNFDFLKNKVSNMEENEMQELLKDITLVLSAEMITTQTAIQKQFEETKDNTNPLKAVLLEKIKEKLIQQFNETRQKLEQVCQKDTKEFQSEKILNILAETCKQGEGQTLQQSKQANRHKFAKLRGIVKRLIKDKVYKQVYEKEHKSLLQQGLFGTKAINQNLDFLSTPGIAQRDRTNTNQSKLNLLNLNDSPREVPTLGKKKSSLRGSPAKDFDSQQTPKSAKSVRISTETDEISYTKFGKAMDQPPVMIKTNSELRLLNESPAKSALVQRPINRSDSFDSDNSQQSKKTSPKRKPSSQILSMLDKPDLFQNYGILSREIYDPSLVKIDEEIGTVTSLSSSAFSKQDRPDLQIVDDSESDDYYGLEDLANIVEEEFLGKLQKKVDLINQTVQDRTSEMRDLTKYVNQMEDRFINQFTDHFKIFKAAFEFQLLNQKEELAKNMEIVKLKIEKQTDLIKQNNEKIDFSESKMMRAMKQKQTEQMVEIRRIYDIADLLKSKYNGLLHHNDYLAKICQMQAEAMDINAVLMFQDERDRSSMSLLGRTGEQKEQQQNQMPQLQSDGSDKQMQVKQHGQKLPITLDKKCISCSDQPGKTLQLFKIACITYFPMPVEYKGENISRIQLLNKIKAITFLIADALKRVGEPLDPFRKDFAQDGETFGTLAEIVDRIKNKKMEIMIKQDKQEAKQTEKSVKQAVLNLKAVEEDEESVKQDNHDVQSEGNSTKMIDEMSSGTKRIDITQDGESTNTRGLEGFSQKSQKFKQDKFKLNSGIVSPLSQTTKNTNLRPTSSDTQTTCKDRRVENALKMLQKTLLKKADAAILSPTTSFQDLDSRQVIEINAQAKRETPDLPDQLSRIKNLKGKALQLQQNRLLSGVKSDGRGRISFSKQPDIKFEIVSQQLIKMPGDREVARTRLTKETQLMIQTQDKFKRTYQFDRMSHQLLSATNLSSQEHADLKMYANRPVRNPLQYKSATDYNIAATQFSSRNLPPITTETSPDLSKIVQRPKSSNIQRRLVSGSWQKLK